MLLRPLADSDAQGVAKIWNAACGPDLAISPRFVVFNLHTPTGAVQMGRMAMSDEVPVGFVLATALPDDPATSPHEIGWIDAIAVEPEFAGRGVGSTLLRWAEG
jgi:ribosomal protein S18 acetylase RimI-like enzyme